MANLVFKLVFEKNENPEVDNIDNSDEHIYESIKDEPIPNSKSTYQISIGIEKKD